MQTPCVFRRISPLLCSLLLLPCLMAAKGGPIKQLTLDPVAEVVPLFEGQKAGQFDVMMNALNAYQSNVIVTNLTAKPLTVAFPKAAVGVQILPQFNNPGGFFNQNQGAGFGNTGAGFGQGQGQLGGAQSVGGPFQGTGTLGQQGQGVGQGFLGQGFPSVPAEMLNDHHQQYGGMATIPPQKSILVRMKSVCLNYGKPEPMSRMTYILIPTEAHSSDPVLAELLENYSDRVEKDVMQAAAWHVANGLSWAQIEQLSNQPLPGVRARLFTQRQVQQARHLVETVTEAAKDRPAANAVAAERSVVKLERQP